MRFERKGCVGNGPEEGGNLPKPPKRVEVWRQYNSEAAITDWRIQSWVNNSKISNSQGETNFDQTSWVAYKYANKGFYNPVFQEIDDSLNKGHIWKLSDGYPIQLPQEEHRETQKIGRILLSSRCDPELSDNEIREEEKTHKKTIDTIKRTIGSNKGMRYLEELATFE
ncbi:hypothetical protein BY996DRAFT_6505417 [Phakopsora pachyrhizi]|nr:hypothetical protein BY996DRAFT_6505417 [Phakopsora pachyrhizi]